jgi:hypothetical protein
VFLSAVEMAVGEAMVGEIRGFRVVTFGRDDRGTLRDVRDGFID